MSIIKELLGSKKFVGALLTMVTAIAVKLGVAEIRVEEIVALVSPMLAYIGAQGFADLGKEKVFAAGAVQESPAPVTNIGVSALGTSDGNAALVSAIVANKDAIREAIQ